MYNLPQQGFGYNTYNPKPKKELVDVAEVLGLGPERTWMYIEGYNGYEISSDGYVRSMKHFNKYPYGILIHPVKGTTDTFVLSNDNNERIKVTLDELWTIANNCKFKKRGYPRKTYQTDRSSRNQRAFIKRDKEVIIEHQFMPKFTILPDSQQQEVKVCPIYDISGRSQYYGR